MAQHGRGESCNLVYPKPSTIKDIVMKSDPADEVLVAEPNPLGSIVWVDPQSPPEARTLFIASPHFVAVKSSSGVRRLPTPESATFTDVTLGFLPGVQPMVYATSEEGAFVSRDGGSSWHKSLLPGTGYEARAIATGLKHAIVAFISYSNLAQKGKTWLGVAKTENAGESGPLAWKESGAAADNVHDACSDPHRPGCSCRPEGSR